MTSLKSFGGFRSDWVTPERLLLLIPLVLGSGIAALLAIVLYLPLLYQVNRLGGLVQGLTDKVALLPVNRQRLRVQLQRFEQARSQEELLLNLVAGPGQLQTLQAQLSQLARSSGVAITGFEPRSGEATAGSPTSKGAAVGSAAAPAGGAPTASPGSPGQRTSDPDPLLSAGLRKKAVLLTVNGPYPNLREFLLAVENLNVIAIATELKLTTGQAAAPSPLLPQAQPSVPTTMTLVLSTYDRPGADPGRPAGVRPKAGVGTP